MRYSIHLFYGVLIVALGCWLVIEKTKEHGRELNLVTGNTLDYANQILEKEKDALFSEISKFTKDYPSERNRGYLNRTQQIRKLSENLKNALLVFENTQIQGENDFNIQSSLLFQKIAEYQDSIILLTDGEKEVKRAILDLKLQDPDLTADDWLSKTLRNARADEIRLILQNILLRVMGAEMVALNYCAKQMAGTDSACFLKQDILSAPENLAPKVGEWYKTEIYAFAYQRLFNFDDPQISVDGQVLPMKDGVSKYQHQYTTPGLKKYIVELTATNSFTGEKEVFKREFSVTVVDSCR
jgi:hypothetical protein